MSIIFGLVTTPAALAAGCGTQVHEIHRANLDAELAEFVSSDDTTAVIILKPSECFVCLSTLVDWEAYSRAHPGRVRTLLDGAPNESEKRALTLARVDIAGVLPAPVSQETPTPIELLYVRGERVLSFNGAALLQNSPMLQLLVHSHHNPPQFQEET